MEPKDKIFELKREIARLNHNFKENDTTWEEVVSDKIKKIESQQKEIDQLKKWLRNDNDRSDKTIERLQANATIVFERDKVIELQRQILTEKHEVITSLQTEVQEMEDVIFTLKDNDNTWKEVVKEKEDFIKVLKSLCRTLLK